MTHAAFDPTVIRIRCPHCGGHLTVQCGPEDPSAGPQPLPCPWCSRVEHRDVGAFVRWVTKGHEPPAEA